MNSVRYDLNLFDFFLRQNFKGALLRLENLPNLPISSSSYENNILKISL